MKYKTFLISLAILLFTKGAEAANFQLLNSEIIGSDTDSSINILNKKKDNEIEPIGVHINIEKGIFVGATLFFSREIEYIQLKEDLITQFGIPKDYDELTVMWRIEKRQYSVMLTADQENIRVNYVKFRETEPPDILHRMKPLMKTKE